MERSPAAAPLRASDDSYAEMVRLGTDAVEEALVRCGDARDGEERAMAMVSAAGALKGVQMELNNWLEAGGDHPLREEAVTRVQILQQQYAAVLNQPSTTRDEERPHGTLATHDRNAASSRFSSAVRAPERTPVEVGATVRLALNAHRGPLAAALRTHYVRELLGFNSPREYQLVAVAPHESVWTALERMEETGKQQLPVVVGSEVLGEVNCSLFARAVVDEQMDQLTVNEVMVPYPWPVVHASETMDRVFDQVARGVAHVLVTDGDEIIGVISGSDTRRFVDDLTLQLARSVGDE
jgi:CBS domain-containing protein